jgi:hypothetical protein
MCQENLTLGRLSALLRSRTDSAAAIEFPEEAVGRPESRSSTTVRANSLVYLGEEVMDTIGVVVLVSALLYFLPSVIAFSRSIPDRGMVLVLNLFLGWTFLGWVVSLARACGSGASANG